MSGWRHWQARRRAAQRAPEARRWVVVDTETSGLDMARDRLIAAAAVAVHWGGGRPCLRPADTFEVVLQCPPGLVLDEVARRNILLHGVGRGEQGGGLPAAEGLQRLVDFVDGAPCVAFHADFDATMLDRACREQLGVAWAPPWLDLAVLARLLHPDLPHRHLDDWLGHFGLAVGQRHRAISDAWVSAELLLRLWPAWRAQGGQQGAWQAAQTLMRARRFLLQNA